MIPSGIRRGFKATVPALALLACSSGGDAETYFYEISEMAFGFYASSGNIRFSGAGVGADADSGFTGDLQAAGQARFIRPAADGLNCGSGTIVVDIQTAGTIGTQDPQTGVYTGGTIGAGTVAIE